MKLQYRPEIDGLRAVAVGAVIIYHSLIVILGYQPFKGGFIGVDIFFVISGYLITSIILKELVSTGSFSFKYFYERRVRRLLPTLLFVMLVSFPFAWMIFLPSNFIDFAKSVLFSLGFSSNFYFHYSGQIYAAESGLLKPFLHTWSLSIEEQFYILFPLVIFFFFKYFRKYLIYSLVVGLIVSFGFAVWTSNNYPSASFYFIHTRAWELLTGSILAYFEVKKGHRSQNHKLNLIMPTIGMLLIFHSFFFFDHQTIHPSFYTLSPIIGVCLIIWYSNKDEIITKILSTKLFVGIGLISYSLYLWHYPVFAFARVTEILSNNILYEIFIGFVILFASIFTYFFIEKPFRNKTNNFKKILIFILSLTLFIIFFNFYIIIKDGLKKRIPNIFDQKLKVEKVNFHQKNNKKKIILIGDSHAEFLEFHLNEKVKENDLSLIRFNTRMYLNNFNYVNRKTKKVDEGYVKQNTKIEKFLNNNTDLIVILSQRWSLRLLETYFDNEEGNREESYLEYHSYLEPLNIKTLSLKERQKHIAEELNNQINKILNKGHKLILVYPSPEMGFHVPKKIYLEYLFKNSIPILSSNFDVYKKRNKLIFEIFENIQSPNIYKIYPHKLFCDKQIKNRCIANDTNNIYYYDDDHLSLMGSKLVVDEIMKEIKKIILKSN